MEINVPFPILTRAGVIEAPVPDLLERKLLQGYWAALSRSLDGDEGADLHLFYRVRIAGYLVETDEAWISHYADRYEFDIELAEGSLQAK